MTHSAKTKKRIKTGVKISNLDLVLGFRPTPVELDVVVIDPDVAETYRFMDCPGYSACLDVACAGVWKYFNCRACNVYRHYSKHDGWTTRIRRV